MIRYNESAGITPTFSAVYILDEVLSGPLALLEPSTNSVLLSLC